MESSRWSWWSCCTHHAYVRLKIRVSSNLGKGFEAAPQKVNPQALNAGYPTMPVFQYDCMCLGRAETLKPYSSELFFCLWDAGQGVVATLHRCAPSSCWVTTLPVRPPWLTCSSPRIPDKRCRIALKIRINGSSSG